MVDVFISFDFEHDGELYDRLVLQSEGPGSGFAVSGGSERFTDSEAWNARARRRIGLADQLIVICGEHTEVAMGVFSELRIAQAEEKDYLLLWGRRESACTKPAGAKNTDGMYSWTWPILQDQITLMNRNAQRDKMAGVVPRAPRSP
jgi:hypothetical protein